MVSFGKSAQIMTSVCMICCNAGFLVSYQVLVSGFKFVVQIFHALLHTNRDWA